MMFDTSDGRDADDKRPTPLLSACTFQDNSLELDRVQRHKELKSACV